jgi:hypothetical protein
LAASRKTAWDWLRKSLIPDLSGNWLTQQNLVIERFPLQIQRLKRILLTDPAWVGSIEPVRAFVSAAEIRPTLILPKNALGNVRPLNYLIFGSCKFTQSSLTTFRSPGEMRLTYEKL